MQCENNLCIYSADGKCILDAISLDAAGMCSDCIHVTIGEEALKAEKAKLLQKFHENKD